jgi:iron-sulfur cluster assembly protein
MFNDLIPVTITDRAINEIRTIMLTKNIPPEYGLRVGIKGSGCGGAALMIGFDKKKKEDMAYIISDIPVYVDKRHTLYVIGKIIDFYESDEARGFMFADQVDDPKT